MQKFTIRLMNQSGKHTCLTSAAAKTELFIGLRCLSPLLIGLLLLALCPAQGQERDDQYLRAFDLIEQADTLNSSGKPGPALAKYQEAQTALQSFQRTYPEWNAKMVSYRLNYVAEQIAVLSAKLAAPAAGTASAAPGSSEAQPATKAGAGASLPQVKLIDAGTEPRKTLRLHPKPGDKQTSVITLKMGMEVKVGEMQNPAMKMPPMKMTMEITVKNVSPDGDISYEMLVSDASLTEEPGINPQLAEAMKASLGNLKGMSGTGTMSSRGFNKNTEVKVPAGADPQTRQAADQMKESLSNLATPLPEEAIGPSAKWEARMPVKSEGMTITQTATYELVSIEGERLNTRNSITQTAANQKIQSPAMPGMKLDLIKMVGNGTGNASLDLARLVPVEGTADLHSELSMAMNMGGQKQMMNTKMDLNLRLEGK